MDFTKALIPKDNYIRYTQTNVGSSSSPSDCTDYGLIFLKTNSTMTAHIRCRPGTWIICQTSSLSNSINCSVYTDYNNYDNVSFTFNVGGQGLEH